MKTNGSEGTTYTSSRPAGSYYDPYYSYYYCYNRLNLLWTFNPYHSYWYNRNDRYSFLSFLTSLSHSGWYDYDAPLVRYSYGDVPWTDEMLEMALSNSRMASGNLLSRVVTLENALVRYEAGELSKEQFEGIAEGTLKEVRLAAKAIRSDQNVDYLDPRTHDSIGPKPKSTKDLAQFRSLLAELREKARMLDARLASLGHEEDGDLRTVSVSSLSQPSADALSEEIDRLAKVIAKSAKRI